LLNGPENALVVCVGFRLGQATVGARSDAARHVAFRAEVAAARIADDTVDVPIECVAFRYVGGADGREFACGEVEGEEMLQHPQAVDVRVDTGGEHRSSDDAVEVIREFLRFLVRLTSAVRAAVEIRMEGAASRIKDLDEFLRFDVRFVNGFVCVVDDEIRPVRGP